MSTAPYKLLEQFKDQFDPNLLFVEIGSERGGGSTSFLNSLALQTQNKFITVDIDPVYLNRTINSKTMSGEQWALTELPALKTQIGLLFLDSFDWIAKPSEVRNGTAPVDVYNEIAEYRKKNLELNNINSAVAHLRQVKAMLPFMNDKCLVMFSDTWFNHNLDTFEGKGAGAVYLLLTEGYNIIGASSKDNYILMARNIRPKNPISNLDISSLSTKYEGPRRPANEIIYNF